MRRAEQSSRPSSATPAAVHARERSAVEIAERTLRAIAREDAELQAFTAVDPEALLAQAKELDRRLRRQGDELELAGLTVGVKDIIDVAGLPTSYNCPALPPRLADRDAACVAALRRAGALIVGKTRTSELALAPDTCRLRTPPTGA